MFCLLRCCSNSTKKKKEEKERLDCMHETKCALPSLHVSHSFLGSSTYLWYIIHLLSLSHTLKRSRTVGVHHEEVQIRKAYSY